MLHKKDTLKSATKTKKIVGKTRKNTKSKVAPTSSNATESVIVNEASSMEFSTPSPKKKKVIIIEQYNRNIVVNLILFLLKNFRLFFRILLFVAVATIISIVVIIKNTDPNKFRDDIENYIEFATGKKAKIEGNLYWRIFSMEPAIMVENLSISNEPWASQKDFITADTIIATISLKNLLARKISVNTIILNKPKIYIDVSKNGRRNWLLPTKKIITQTQTEKSIAAMPAGTLPTLSKKTKNPADSANLAKSIANDSLLKKQYQHNDESFEVDIKNIKVKNAQIFYNNKQRGIKEDFTLNSLFITSATYHSPILISLDTNYKQIHLTGSFKTNSLENILANPNNINITGVTSINNMDVKFSGLLSDIEKNTPSISASIFLDIPDIKSSLNGLVSMPNLSPISAELEVIATGTFISIKKLLLTYKSLNLSGTSEITLKAGKHPSIKADLSIPLFDIPNLFYPAWEPAYFERLRTNQPKPKSKPKAVIKDPKAFRNIPLPVSELDWANVNLKLHIDKLKAMPEMAINDIKMVAILSNGKGVIAPIAFNYMGGRVLVDIIADNYNNTFNGQVAIKGENINVGQIVDSTGYKDVFNGGNTNIDIILSGSGRNLAKFMSGLHGYIKIYTTSQLTGYRIESMLMAGDIGTSIFKFFRDDVIGTISGEEKKKDKSEIKCAVINLNVKDGKTESNQGIALETKAANIIVDGSVNFATEYLDVSVVTVVKEGLKLSGNLADMVKIQGSMAAPSIIMNKNGIISNIAKTTIATALAGALTGGISLVATGIGFFTKSWLDNIQADKHPCLTALDGPSTSKHPKVAEEFRNQINIKRDMRSELHSERKKLNTQTSDEIETEKLKVKSSNK